VQVRERIDGKHKTTGRSPSQHQDDFLTNLGTMHRSSCAMIEAIPGFEYVSTESDSLGLEILSKENHTISNHRKTHNVEWRFYHRMQVKKLSHKSIRDRFNNCVNVIEHCSGILVDCEDMEEELIILSLAFIQQPIKKLWKQSKEQKTRCLECPTSCVLNGPSLEIIGGY